MRARTAAAVLALVLPLVTLPNLPAHHRPPSMIEATWSTSYDRTPVIELPACSCFLIPGPVLIRGA